MKKLVRAIENIVNPPDATRIGPQAAGFRIGVNMPEGKLRIILCDENGVGLAHLEFISPDAYGFADHILKGYDRLEGIK